MEASRLAGCEAGAGTFQQMREQGKAHQIEKVGAELRAMMSWLQSQQPAEKTKEPATEPTKEPVHAG